MKLFNDIKTRSRRPRVNEDVYEYATVKEVNELTHSMGSFFDDQQKAYGELKDLRTNSGDNDIVMVSGIVEKAEAVESDLNWAVDKLNCLNTRKKTLYSENEAHYLGYEFKEFSKPSLLS